MVGDSAAQTVVEIAVITEINSSYLQFIPLWANQLEEKVVQHGRHSVHHGLQYQRSMNSANTGQAVTPQNMYCTYIYMYIKPTHTRTHKRTHACTHARTHAHMHTHTHTHTKCTHTHTNTHTHTHTQHNTHTHTHTRTYYGVR